MFKNHQEETAIITAESDPVTQNFAIIGAIYTDGVSLIFDGTESATSKHYKVNTSESFAAGDRVKIFKYSGTYIVECVI